MSWSVRPNENIADVCITINSTDTIQLFKDITDAFARLTAESLPSETVYTHEVDLSEATIEELVFSYINELVYQKDTEGVLFVKGEFTLHTDKEKPELHADLSGVHLDSLETKLDIKALARHKFHVQKTDSGYDCTLVFDI